MEPLIARTQSILAASMAASTKCTYRRAVESFIAFRNDWSLGNKWPASINQVVAYIAYLNLKTFMITIFTVLLMIIFIQCLTTISKLSFNIHHHALN